MLKVVEARIAADRMFHSHGAALAKDLSAEVRNRLSGSVSSSQSLDRYVKSMGQNLAAAVSKQGRQ